MILPKIVMVLTIKKKCCDCRKIPHNILIPVSYTHLDVYKRQLSLSLSLFLYSIGSTAAGHCSTVTHFNTKH